VSINDYFVVIWTDSVPAEGRLSGAARARAGQLLAAGPVYDVSEQDSRPAPAGMVVARFADAGNAATLVRPLLSCDRRSLARRLVDPAGGRVEP
jgi:hypothetical protein